MTTTETILFVLYIACAATWICSPRHSPAERSAGRAAAAMFGLLVILAIL